MESHQSRVSKRYSKIHINNHLAIKLWFILHFHNACSFWWAAPKFVLIPLMMLFTFYWTPLPTKTFLFLQSISSVYLNFTFSSLILDTGTSSLLANYSSLIFMKPMIFSKVMFSFALTKSSPLGLIVENLYCNKSSVCSLIGSFILSLIKISFASKLLIELNYKKYSYLNRTKGYFVIINRPISLVNLKYLKSFFFKGIIS